MNFIDSTEIFVSSGSGGNGLVSFKTASNKPRLGPDGGDGGHGGNVFIVAAPQLNTLSPVRYRCRYIAENGERGGPNGRTGKCGLDLEVPVPLGTEVYDVDTGRLICEILFPGQQEVVATGGRRGFGNLRFVSSTHQAPEEYVEGQAGQQKNLRLELKLLADVGLAGLPNAGKSTLLSVLSNARPKIADYPFTTLEPHLGVVEIMDRGEFHVESFVMADIPGLIDGASDGKGLGHQFLRHLERTKIIAYVIDSCPLDGSDPLDALKLLQKELATYDQTLYERPAVVIFNKIDQLLNEEDAQEKMTRLTREVEVLGLPVRFISAACAQGTQELKIYLNEFVKQQKSFPVEKVIKHDSIRGLYSTQVLKDTEKKEMQDFRAAIDDGRAFFVKKAQIG